MEEAITSVRMTYKKAETRLEEMKASLTFLKDPLEGLRDTSESLDKSPAFKWIE